MNKIQQDALFGELFEAYRQPIFAYLVHMVGDLATSEELVQDVFLNAYRALPRLDATANRRAWVYKIATNAARDWFRRQRVRRWLPFASDSGEDAEHREDRDEVDEPAQESPLPTEDALAVADALGKLKPMYREPLILFAVQGLSTEEIGAILGLSRSGVKMRLARARALFARAYGADNHASA